MVKVDLAIYLNHPHEIATGTCVSTWVVVWGRKGKKRRGYLDSKEKKRKKPIGPETMSQGTDEPAGPPRLNSRCLFLEWTDRFIAPDVFVFARLESRQFHRQTRPSYLQCIDITDYTYMHLLQKLDA